MVMMEQKFTGAPVLETERLILRPHRLEDFPTYEAMFQHPDFTRYTTGQPLSREDAWTKMIRHGGHWQMMGYGYWAIEQKSTGLFIGEMGFADFKRPLTPSFEGKMEAGWGLVTECHGKGIASEALKAALSWADENYPDLDIVCMIAPDNKSSIQLAEKHGFHFWIQTKYKEFDSLFYQRLKR